MSDRIARGVRVSLAYRLMDDQGRLLEERTPESPAIFVQGDSSVLPAIERALEGHGAGHRAVLQLAAAQAFGEYDSSLVAEIERAKFPAGSDPQPGAKFSTIGPDGKPAVIRVLEADDEVVTVDGNHPLAGVDVTIELSVLEVGGGPSGGEGEGGEEEPVDDGGPHGPGGFGPGGETIH